MHHPLSLWRAEATPSPLSLLPARGQPPSPLTLPWLVVQLKPRFLASRPQSKPLRCNMRAASAAGKVSWKTGSAQGSRGTATCLPRRQGWTEERREEGQSPAGRVSTDWDTHLGWERAQIEQMEVTGQWRSQRVERAQSRAGALPLGHG